MPQPSSHLLIGLAYVGFVSLGLPDGLLGVAWPSIRTFFHLPLDALGALLVMFTAGYLGSSFSSGHLLARLSVGALLALSCLATAISLLGYALTPHKEMMLEAAMGSTRRGVHCFSGRAVEQTYVGALPARAYE